MCEDLIGVGKNSGQAKTGRFFRRPERTMYAGLKQSVLHERHDFRPVAPELVAMTSKGDTLPKSAFRACPADRSLPFQRIVGTSSATEWFSPSASNTPVPFADMAFLADIERGSEPNFELIAKAWHGEILELKHKLAVHLRRPDGSSLWALALAHFSGSACLVLPCARIDMPSGLSYFDITLPLGEPLLVAVTDWSFDACSLRWRSWAWQCKHCPELRRSAPAIRPFVEGAVANIKVVASKAGWWSCSRTTLVAYSKQLGLVVPDAGTLFSVLLSLVQHCIPGMSDDEVLSVVRKRLGFERGEISYADELFEIQEAVEFLDVGDRKLVAAEKASTRIKESSFNELKAAFTEKVKEVRERQQVAARAARPSGGRAARKAPQRKFNFSISHAEAKAHIPDGCSIWRGLTRRQWCGHCEPNPRVSFNWDREGGERAAMIACIRRLWVEHVALTGQGPEACPWADLL